MSADIEAYIKQLQVALPHVPPVSERDLRVLYRQKDYEGMVRLVRRTMNLDVKFTVGWVNSGGPKGLEDAPAWVKMPERMPYYGSPEFKKLKLTIFVRKSFLALSTCEQISIAIAHELSHIILDSIGHPLRREEKAVDLTAMLLGFSHMYRRAAFKKTYYQHQTETHRLGYLTEHELDEACRILLPTRIRALHRLREVATREAPRLVMLAIILAIFLLGFVLPKLETMFSNR